MDCFTHLEHQLREDSKCHDVESLNLGRTLYFKVTRLWDARVDLFMQWVRGDVWSNTSIDLYFLSQHRSNSVMESQRVMSSNKRVSWSDIGYYSHRFENEYALTIWGMLRREVWCMIKTNSQKLFGIVLVIIGRDVVVSFNENSWKNNPVF